MPEHWFPRRFHRAAAILGVAVFLLAGSPVPSWSQSAAPPAVEFGQQSKDSVWVPTPERMIRRLLQIADTTKDDVVVDLGAGDGRIPIHAAKHFGARGIAVELEENLVEVARQAAAREGVAQRVQVIQQDLFEADLSEASVVALYISPGAMQRLKPRLLKLKPGTRVVSHQFDLGDWEPDEKVEVEGRSGYLWVVPAPADGAWRVSIAGEEFQLRLEQRYQKLSGHAERDGKKVPVLSARLRGAEIRFGTFDRDGTSRQYTGRLEGGRITGSSDAGLGTAPRAWSAVREPLSASAQAAGAFAGPYVPTPHSIADSMLTLANIGSDDYLIDLGSGDGRLVIAAVAKYKARGASGIEINADLVKHSIDEARKAGVADRARFIAGDLFAADIERATIVTLYLLPGIMASVEAKLGKELKRGTRVVSHDYPLPSWKPMEVITFDATEKVAITGTPRTVLYLYRVP